jgi:carboxylesterase type B
MPPVHVTLAGRDAAARRRFGPLADEFLGRYPAGTDDEAALAGNAAVHDNARISTHLWATDWVRHAGRPVFTYFWTRDSPAGGQHPRRASHGSEIDFVFGNLPDGPEWTDEDRSVAELMSGYWANFVATGDPNGPGLPRWPAYAAGSTTVMELGGRFGPIPLAEPVRLGFWKRFFDTQRAW